jgi:hypothetical protein
LPKKFVLFHHQNRRILEVTISDEETRAKCLAVRAKYKGLSVPEARLLFGYEYQGYVAYMLDNNFPLTEINGELVHLMSLFIQAQENLEGSTQ